MSKISNVISSFKSSYNELDSEFKRNLFKAFSAYFLVLFSYSFIRSAVGALFLDHYPAKNTALVWTVSICLLTVTIGIMNSLKARLGVQKSFFAVALFTVLSMIASVLLLEQGFSVAAYFLASWKEVYIVILIHTILGYANTVLTTAQLKNFFGFLGGLGSFGGFLGGLAMSKVAKGWGTENTLYFALMFVFISGIIFLFTKSFTYVESKDGEIEEKKSPLESIQGVKEYVFLIACIVTLSQFVIAIANFKFNLVFAEIVTNKGDRSSYLGFLYSMTNLATMIFQFIFMPFFLNIFSNKIIQYTVPILYMLLITFGLGLGGNVLFSVAAVFVLLKATDYSLFAAAKELLYSPLSKPQKFGAKYVTDMLFYRLSKAGIGLFLYRFNSLTLLNSMFYGFIGLWLVILVRLTKKYSEITQA